MIHESLNISKPRSYVKNPIINERAAHTIYSLSSLAHDSAMMTLESRSRQSLGEDVCRLILDCDLVDLHFGFVYIQAFCCR